MRIWYQSMTDLERLPHYAKVLTDHIGEVATDEVAIDVVGVPPGTYGVDAPMSHLRYPAGFHRALLPVLDYVVQAQNQGYDAFVMGSFVAPFLREARSSVVLPVASMAESALLVGRSLSRRIAMICISADQVGTATDLVEVLQLGAFVRTTRSLEDLAPGGAPDESVLSQALTTSGGRLLEMFVRACREAISGGADLIIPAEGILSEVVRLNGIRDVDGAPVMDCVEVSISHAALLARLVKNGSVGVGRRTYPMQPPSGSQRM